jgi:hypothetical protein
MADNFSIKQSAYDDCPRRVFGRRSDGSSSVREARDAVLVGEISDFCGRRGGSVPTPFAGNPMTNIARTLLMALVAALAVPAGASATTYGNFGSWTGSSGFPFGYPDTTAYGQVFTAPESRLDSWLFLISTGSAAGNAKFVIAPWNGTAPVGPAIYESSALAIDHTSSADYAFNGVKNIALPLSIGQQYIAYFSVAGVDNPVVSREFASTISNGGLAGGNTFKNSNGADPLLTLDGWAAPGATAGGNWVYTANFSTVAATPIPAALPLFASALGGLGFVGWRRRARASAR